MSFNLAGLRVAVSFGRHAPQLAMYGPLQCLSIIPETPKRWIPVLSEFSLPAPADIVSIVAMNRNARIPKKVRFLFNVV